MDVDRHCRPPRSHTAELLRTIRRTPFASLGPSVRLLTWTAGAATSFKRSMNQVRLSIYSVKLPLLAAALLWSTQLARAEYRLQGGDVIEISVAGVPELKQRAPVQFDGSITFPLVGTLMVEGTQFSEIRSKIQSAVAGKIFRMRTPDGRELPR